MSAPIAEPQVAQNQGYGHDGYAFGKVGNPGPLGLISFALTTFVLGIYQAGAA